MNEEPNRNRSDKEHDYLDRNATGQVALAEKEKRSREIGKVIHAASDRFGKATK